MSDDTEILDRMRLIVESKKRLVLFSKSWQETPHKSTVKLEFVTSLEVDSITLEGVRLRGRAIKSLPESDTMFQLEMRYGSEWHHLCRLDWRPKHSHTDQVGPISDRANFSGSGWHSFDNNSKYGLWTLRDGNLPRAVAIAPEPQNFIDVLKEVERRMLIDNACDIAAPNWETQGTLL